MTNRENLGRCAAVLGMVAATACSQADGPLVEPAKPLAFDTPAAFTVQEGVPGAGVQLSAGTTQGPARRFDLAGGPDADRFALHADGRLRFRMPPDFERPADADADNLYEVTVRATGAFGASATQDVTVRVTDAPDGLLVTRGWVEVAAPRSSRLSIDADGDGTPDLIGRDWMVAGGVTGPRYALYGAVFAGGAAVANATADGAVGTGAVRLIADSNALPLGDLDGDGRPELILVGGGRSSWGNLYVLPPASLAAAAPLTSASDDQETFEIAASPQPDVSDCAPDTVCGTQVEAQSIEPVGDIDQDGLEDLLLRMQRTEYLRAPFSTGFYTRDAGPSDHLLFGAAIAAAYRSGAPATLQDLMDAPTTVRIQGSPPDEPDGRPVLVAYDLGGDADGDGVPDVGFAQPNSYTLDDSPSLWIASGASLLAAQGGSLDLATFQPGGDGARIDMRLGSGFELVFAGATDIDANGILDIVLTQQEFRQGVLDGAVIVPGAVIGRVGGDELRPLERSDVWRLRVEGAPGARAIGVLPAFGARGGGAVAIGSTERDGSQVTGTAFVVPARSILAAPGGELTLRAGDRTAMTLRTGNPVVTSVRAGADITGDGLPEVLFGTNTVITSSPGNGNTLPPSTIGLFVASGGFLADRLERGDPVLTLD